MVYRDEGYQQWTVCRTMYGWQKEVPFLTVEVTTLLRVAESFPNPAIEVTKSNLSFECPASRLVSSLSDLDSRSLT
jgi:hypothetical protein